MHSRPLTPCTPCALGSTFAQFAAATVCTNTTRCAAGANWESIPATLSSDRSCYGHIPTRRRFFVGTDGYYPESARLFCASKMSGGVMAKISNSSDLSLLGDYVVSSGAPGLFVGLQRSPTLPTSCASPFYWSDGSGTYSSGCGAGGSLLLSMCPPTPLLPRVCPHLF